MSLVFKLVVAGVALISISNLYLYYRGGGNVYNINTREFVMNIGADELIRRDDSTKLKISTVSKDSSYMPIPNVSINSRNTPIRGYVYSKPEQISSDYVSDPTVKRRNVLGVENNISNYSET